MSKKISKLEDFKDNKVVTLNQSVKDRRYLILDLWEDISTISSISTDNSSDRNYNQIFLQINRLKVANILNDRLYFDLTDRDDVVNDLTVVEDKISIVLKNYLKKLYKNKKGNFTLCSIIKDNKGGSGEENLVLSFNLNNADYPICFYDRLKKKVDISHLKNRDRTFNIIFEIMHINLDMLEGLIVIDTRLRMVMENSINPTRVQLSDVDAFLQVEDTTEDLRNSVKEIRDSFDVTKTEVFEEDDSYSDSNAFKKSADRSTPISNTSPYVSQNQTKHSVINKPAEVLSQRLFNDPARAHMDEKTPSAQVQPTVQNVPVVTMVPINGSGITSTLDSIFSKDGDSNIDSLHMLDELVRVHETQKLTETHTDDNTSQVGQSNNNINSYINVHCCDNNSSCEKDHLSSFDKKEAIEFSDSSDSSDSSDALNDMDMDSEDEDGVEYDPEPSRLKNPHNDIISNNNGESDDEGNYEIMDEYICNNTDDESNDNRSQDIENLDDSDMNNDEIVDIDDSDEEPYDSDHNNNTREIDRDSLNDSATSNTSVVDDDNDSDDCDDSDDIIENLDRIHKKMQEGRKTERYNSHRR